MNDEIKMKAEIDRITAERDKFIVEAESFKSERKKYEAELSEITSRLNQPWYRIRLVSIIQALIAGIVAGALIWSFAIEHIKKLYELQTKLVVMQKELEKENEKLQEDIKSLEKDKKALSESLDDHRNTIVNLESKIASQPDVREYASKQLEHLSNVQQKFISESEEFWFPVIASTYNEKDLEGRLSTLRRQKPEYKIEIYRASDGKGRPVYAITLGGYLSKKESEKRVKYARSNDIANDAYSWNSTKWGNDISNEFIK